MIKIESVSVRCYSPDARWQQYAVCRNMKSRALVMPLLSDVKTVQCRLESIFPLNIVTFIGLNIVSVL